MIDIFIKYRYLIYYLVIRDIKKKYKRSALGILWSMLNPLLMMLITAMVFSQLFKFEIKNFPLYLLTGQIMLNFYSEATNNSMKAILDNSALLKKVYVPQYMFPVASAVSSCVNLILSLPAIVIIMWYTGEYPSIEVLSFMIPLLGLLLFCMGIGLILSSLAVFFRDTMHLYGVVLTALNYATPIFYPETIIPDSYKFILILNPLYYYLKDFRQVLYMGSLPDVNNTIICYGIGIITLVIGCVIFQKTHNKFILYI
ncbi:MAG: ABC transporter permease [Selenomonadaceae bacterium]|nr:ABC transporter permease [Selenomonadaceae bacterium]